MSEGNNNSEASKAIINIMVDKIPNWELGLKLENIRTTKPIARVIVVLIIALPVVNIVFEVDITCELVLLYSLLNLDKKWIVSSTAIPNAIEKVIAVAGLKDIAVYPITPPANRSGKTFGIIDTTESLKDLKSMFIDINIIIKAIIKLFNKLLNK